MIRTTSMIKFHVYVIFDKHEMHMNVLYNFMNNKHIYIYNSIFFKMSIHYMYLASKLVARLTA